MVARLTLIPKKRSSSVARCACFVGTDLESESADAVCLNFDVFYGILEASIDIL